MGGGSSSSTSISFNDTSERIYRDTSEKAAGFTFEAGFLREDRDRATNLTENEDRVTEQLDLACRTMIKDMVTKLSAETDSFLQDRPHIIERAHTAWDRAVNLYPEFRTQLGTELDDIKVEFTNRICQWELQWQRTAGSSLNCLVQDMKIKAEVELARRLGGVLASQLNQFRQHETAAIQQSFQMEFMAHYELNKMAFGQIGNLLGVLKGAFTTEDRDRLLNENVAEDVNQLRAMGNYFRNAKSIGSSEGTYSGDVDDLAAAADAVSGG